jgi:hypothetical protein
LSSEHKFVANWTWPIWVFENQSSPDENRKWLDLDLNMSTLLIRGCLRSRKAVLQVVSSPPSGTIANGRAYFLTATSTHHLTLEKHHLNLTHSMNRRCSSLQMACGYRYKFLRSDQLVALTMLPKQFIGEPKGPIYVVPCLIMPSASVVKARKYTGPNTTSVPRIWHFVSKALYLKHGRRSYFNVLLNPFNVKWTIPSCA